jgi:hypothetical protein
MTCLMPNDLNMVALLLSTCRALLVERIRTTSDRKHAVPDAKYRLLSTRVAHGSIVFGASRGRVQDAQVKGSRTPTAISIRSNME